MRKVIVSIFMSLDGFFEYPDQSVEWFVFDDEMQAYFDELVDSVDTMLFGRVAYQGLAAFWQAQPGSFAEKMNQKPKIVFSRTLEKVEWNARLVRQHVAEEITRLKKADGKDLVLFAGADLLSSFRKLGLIDEYRIVVNPVVLGKGKPLFKDVTDRFGLKFLKSRTFGCGTVLLIYRPV